MVEEDKVKRAIAERLKEPRVQSNRDLMSHVKEATGTADSTYYKKLGQMVEDRKILRRERGRRTWYALPENAKELDEMVGLEDEMAMQLKELVGDLLRLIETYPYGTATEALAPLGSTTPQARAKTLFGRVIHFEKANNVRFRRPWEGERPDPVGFAPSESDPSAEEWHQFYLNVLDRLIRQDF
jgi:hypothetical protein